MAKITRKTAQIFGSTASANQIAKFGSLAAAAPVLYSGATADPANIQSLANWLTGWFAGVEGASSPAIEDLNAFCFVMAYQIAYCLQAGVPEWDSGTTYYIGSMVSSGSSLYISLIDNNLNNAVSNTADWISAPNQFYNQRTSPAAQSAVLGGFAISADTGDTGSVITSGTFVNFPSSNLSISLVTSGRQVVVALVPNNQALAETHQPGVISSSGEGTVRIVRDVGGSSVGYGAWSTADSGSSAIIRAGTIMIIDQPLAGSHTYNLQGKIVSGNLTAYNCQLIAYER